MAPSGRVTTILGGYVGSLATSWYLGYNDGPASMALFNSPRGVLVNGSGIAYAPAPLVAWVADSGACAEGGRMTSLRYVHVLAPLSPDYHVIRPPQATT